MKFYYGIEKNDQIHIFQYISDGIQIAQNKFVYKISADSFERRFFVTDDYVIYSNDRYMTHLYNRQTNENTCIYLNRTFNQFIFDNRIYFFDEDDRVPLRYIKLDDVFDGPSFKKFHEFIGGKVWTKHFYHDIVIQTKGGFFTAEDNAMKEESNFSFKKTNYNGDVPIQYTLKTNNLIKLSEFEVCADTELTAFEVCGDTVYAAIYIGIHNAKPKLGTYYYHIIKKIFRSDIIDFHIFEKSVYIYEIQATEWMVAVLIAEKNNVEFYTLNGKRVLRANGFFEHIYKVGAGAFVLATDKAAYLYDWKSKPEYAKPMIYNVTKICDGKISSVQPNIT